MAKFCSNCPFGEKENSSCHNNEYFDWYCTHQSPKDTLEGKGVTKRKCASWLYKTTVLNAPTWCPLESFENTKKIQSGEQREPRYTSASAYKAWNNLPSICKWEDIKTKTIYHVPPVNGDIRLNIMITTKDDYCITGRVVGGIDNGKIMTLYKSSLKSKFLIEDKLEKSLINKLTNGEKNV